MAKEITKERKCYCGQILPKKSRSDKKTCSDYCRKKYSLIATIGDYKRSEISSKGKKSFAEAEYIKERINHIQWLILETDKAENTQTEDYKAIFLNYTIDSIRYAIKQLQDLENSTLDKINISEGQEILDELDDRDNDRNENLFN